MQQAIKVYATAQETIVNILLYTIMERNIKNTMCVCVYIYIYIYITESKVKEFYFLKFSNVYLFASFSKCNIHLCFIKKKNLKLQVSLTYHACELILILI